MPKLFLFELWDFIGNLELEIGNYDIEYVIIYYIQRINFCKHKFYY